MRSKFVILADTVFGSIVDAAIWMVAFYSELSLPQSRNGQLWRANIEADKLLRDINYQTIKQAINNAKRYGWVKKNKKRYAWPELTKEGIRRLNSIVPHYDGKRAWNKRMHIVTYDIPEQKRHDRTVLREYLRRIGCGRLQDSVWITPYDPIDTIRSFVEEKKLSGTVIVSDLGTDGSIGEEDLHALVVRVYGLEVLNDRYEKLLRDIQINTSHANIFMQYMSILHDDPQLPFALLPKWWKGDEVFKKLYTSKIVNGKPTGS